MNHSIPFLSHCDPALVDYLFQAVLPRYADFDKAHQQDHALTVLSGSLELAARLRLDYNMVLTIAVYHDAGLGDGRELHHIRSGEMLMSDVQLLRWFHSDQLAVMREAIEDHRASNSASPRSIYGKVVAEADRIIDCEVTLRRTVQYGLSHNPELDREGQYARFCDHLEKKYGRNGYLHLWLELDRNVEGLSSIRLLIEDGEALRSKFDLFYDQEALK